MIDSVFWFNNWCVSSLSFIPWFIVDSLPIHAASFIFKGQSWVSVLVSGMLIVILGGWAHVLRCLANALVPLHFMDDRCSVIRSFNFLLV